MAWQHPRRRDLLILDVGLEGAARTAGNRPTLRAGVAGGGGCLAEEPGEGWGGEAERRGPGAPGKPPGGVGAKQLGSAAPATEANGTIGGGGDVPAAAGAVAERAEMSGPGGGWPRGADTAGCDTDL